MASTASPERLRWVARRMQDVPAFRDATSRLALALFEQRDEISPKDSAAKFTAGFRFIMEDEARAMGSDLSVAQMDELAASLELAALDMLALIHDGGLAQFLKN